MTTKNPEDAAQGQPLKRRNSRFLLEETKEKKSDEKD